MAEYKQPKPVPADTKGFETNIPKTNTKPMRGAGAATQGKTYSKNSQ